MNPKRNNSFKQYNRFAKIKLNFGKDPKNIRWLLCWLLYETKSILFSFSFILKGISKQFGNGSRSNYLIKTGKRFILFSFLIRFFLGMKTKIDIYFVYRVYVYIHCLTYTWRSIENHVIFFLIIEKIDSCV